MANENSINLSKIWNSFLTASFPKKVVAGLFIIGIILSLAYAAQQGVNVSLNLEVQARLDYLETQQQLLNDTINIPVNSTISAMIKEANYIIAPHDSYYCLINGTDDRAGRLEYYSTNKTKTEQFALGNMTTGLLYLKEVTHNTSLSITATQTVAQQISGKIRYFTSTGSTSVTDCPVPTTDTFVLTSDTDEHTIVTLTPTSVEQVTNFYLDLSELTQNCTLRVYLKIDGVNYVEMTSMTLTVAAGTKGLALKDHVIDTDWKLTIQSVVAEGASRSIDYRYFVNVY